MVAVGGSEHGVAADGAAAPGRVREVSPAAGAVATPRRAGAAFAVARRGPGAAGTALASYRRGCRRATALRPIHVAALALADRGGGVRPFRPGLADRTPRRPAGDVPARPGRCSRQRGRRTRAPGGKA